MASVWIARLQGKHGFAKLVAVKMILPQYSADPRFQQMFLDEARIAAGIEHINVAHILDLGEQHDVLYIVMEWVDGDALSKLHRAVERAKKDRGRGSDSGITPAGIWLRRMAGACGGPHGAHELHDTTGIPLGVVHRDVSPQNILINPKGVAKLIDFGVAKARHRLVGETNSGNLKGKIQYMAPEQALGRQVDRRTDIWAAGAILYQLFAGRPPFEADNQLATLHLLASGRPPVPLGADVPRPIAAIIRRALSHDPRQRYETAADLQAALEGAMVETGLPTTTQDVAEFAQAHLSERAAARREALELAIAAATERARMSGLLKPPSQDSANGDTEISVDVARAVASFARKPSASVADAATVAAPSSVDEILAAAPLVETSSATLGSAAFDNSYPAPIVRTSPPRRLVPLIGAFAGAALVLTAAVTLVRARGDETKSAAASPTTTSVVLVGESPSPATPPALPPAVVASPPSHGTTSSATPHAATPHAATSPAPAPLSKLPVVAVAPPPRVKVVVKPAAAPPPAATPASPPPAPSAPKKKVIDDGF